MSSNYTKLFHSILQSTVWQESPETRVLWVTMLAMTDKHGEIAAAVPGLARMAGLSLEQTLAGLQKFSEPDKYSRTKEYEGRRIEEIDGGWRLLNHSKYRALMSLDERREYDKLKKREYRAKDKLTSTHSCDNVQNVSTNVYNVHDKSTESRHTDTDTDTDTVKTNDKSPEKAPTTLKEDFAKEFFELWNQLGEPFPKIAKWSKKRDLAFKERLRDLFFYGNWRIALQKIKASPFCRGVSERGWIADVEFFLRPDSCVKIIEGKYDERTSGNTPKRNGAAVNSEHTQKQLSGLMAKIKSAKKASADGLLPNSPNPSSAENPDSGGNPPEATQGDQVCY